MSIPRKPALLNTLPYQLLKFHRFRDFGCDDEVIEDFKLADTSESVKALVVVNHRKFSGVLWRGKSPPVLV